MLLKVLHKGLLLLCTAFQLYKADKTKICFESKTCIHNAAEKCGVNSEGEVRRFLDSCDMLEYNCLEEANFKKTSLTKCRSLPPFFESGSNSQQHNDFKFEILGKSSDDESEGLSDHGDNKPQKLAVEDLLSNE